MKIAVVTGASSGIGVDFYKEIQKEDIDSVWIIARREDRLNEIKDRFGIKDTRVIPMDITLDSSMDELKELFEKEGADIRFLINNAGMGVIGNLEDADRRRQGMMVELNCKALTEITVVALPYMSEGASIINTCSIASFVPNAKMTVYSSTKAYVMSFTKALRYELRKRKINVTAVCPGPMRTEFLEVAGIEKGVSKTFDMLPYCDPARTAKKGIRAAKRGRCVYTPRGFYKFYRILAKLMPSCIMIRLAKC